MLLFLFLFFTSSLALENGIKIPLTQHLVRRDVLIQRQAARLEKSEKEGRLSSKFHSRFLESPYKNDYITAPIQLGTPPQTFNVMLSTGSTRLWVLSSDYEDLAAGQNAYNLENSSTGVSLEQDFENFDGSFYAGGLLVSDSFSFGNLSVTDQAFGAVFYVSEVIQEAAFPINGVLGLNHLNASAYGKGKEHTSPIDNLLRSLANKMFTLFLDKHQPPSKSLTSSGQLTLGAFDNEHCNQNQETKIYFSPLTNDNRLLFTISSIVNGNYSSSKGGPAYADTGVSTLMLPFDDYGAIINQIKTSYNWDTNVYSVDCDEIDNLSTIVFGINGAKVTINPSNYVVDLDLPSNQCALSINILSPEFETEVYVLGTPFARSYCQVYEIDQNYLTLYDHINA